MVATGPKAYSMEICDANNEKTNITKVKGFTLDHKNSLKLNHETMSRMVESYVKNGEFLAVETERPTIKRNIDRQLTNVVQRKRFQLTNRKRVIKSDYRCYPFGYDNKNLK